ncbi:MAG: MFS transporter [bacterium]|nr:MFS transporter [bacterium]MDE0241148.1 MFS transporter [bacterium]
MFQLIKRNARFRVFVLAQCVLNSAEAAGNVIIPLVVLDLTGSATLVSFVVVLEMVPYFVFHLPFGALLDRHDRKRLMILADFGRALLLLLVVIVHFLDGPVLIALFAVAVPFGTLASVSDAARSAIVPRLVEKTELEGAYGWTEATESVAWIAGPAIAGFTVATVGTVEALSLVSAFLAAFALAILFVRIDAPVHVSSSKSSILRDIREGLSFFLRHTRLRTMQLIWTAYGAVGYGVVLGLVYVGSGGDASDALAASFAVSSYAAGSVLGTFCSGFLKLRTGIIPAWCLIVFSAGAMLIAQGGFHSLLTGAFLIGAGEGFLLVLYLSARASHTPDHLMARVVSASALFDKGAGMLAALWIGFSLSVVGGSATFLVIAGFGVALAFLAVALRSRLERRTGSPGP